MSPLPLSPQQTRTPPHRPIGARIGNAARSRTRRRTRTRAGDAVVTRQSSRAPSCRCAQRNGAGNDPAGHGAVDRAGHQCERQLGVHGWRPSQTDRCAVDRRRRAARRWHVAGADPAPAPAVPVPVTRPQHHPNPAGVAGRRAGPAHRRRQRNGRRDLPGPGAPRPDPRRRRRPGAAARRRRGPAHQRRPRTDPRRPGRRPTRTVALHRPAPPGP